MLNFHKHAHTETWNHGNAFCYLTSTPPHTHMYIIVNYFSFFCLFSSLCQTGKMTRLHTNPNYLILKVLNGPEVC